jgi:hypothetical protein
MPRTPGRSNSADLTHAQFRPARPRYVTTRLNQRSPAGISVIQANAYVYGHATPAHRQNSVPDVPCQISRPVASQSGPFACPCQRSGPKRSQLARQQPAWPPSHPEPAVLPTRALERSLAAGQPRSGRINWQNAPRTPSRADLDHDLHLDRLPLNQAHPGHRFSGGQNRYK